MRLAACATVLEQHEIEQIHNAMLRIVSEVGMKLENDTILTGLAELGASVDREAMIARFAPDVVERLIADSEEFDWNGVKPQISASAGVFLGRYLDPETDQHVPWTAERILAYAKTAHYLEHVSGASMLGCPVPDVPHPIHPLYQRYFCWKHGLGSGGSLWDIRLCPYIWEMCETMGAATGKPASQYFNGSVYPSTTLLLPRTEAEQFVYFAERGLHVGIGHMTSAGGSAPVTIAGAVTLHLAEEMIINFIQRAFYGTRALALRCTIAPLDMRTLMYPYGRPERQLANIMMADLAKHYRASFAGHGGHTDAKRPSPEAGAQRALTTIPTLMAGGVTRIGAGLLSVDEVFSPIQMIIDNEYVAALKRFARGCEISEETLAVDVVREVGPGNLFTGAEHTVRHFRNEQWEPRIWSRTMFDPWIAAGATTDVDRAREIHRDIMSKPDLPVRINDDTDRELRRIMDRALAALTGAEPDTK